MRATFGALHDMPKLAADELDAQGQGQIEGGFVTDGDGLLDLLEPLLDELLAARTLAIIEIPGRG